MVSFMPRLILIFYEESTFQSLRSQLDPITVIPRSPLPGTEPLEVHSSLQKQNNARFTVLLRYTISVIVVYLANIYQLHMLYSIGWSDECKRRKKDKVVDRTLRLKRPPAGREEGPGKSGLGVKIRAQNLVTTHKGYQFQLRFGMLIN